MTKAPETEHVIVREEKGKNRYVVGSYQCKCGQEFPTFHKWRDHRSEERRKRFAVSQ